ncbi:glycogen synthase [Candidatus Gottesmanbacteria bacterium]|nr:glycogen synthase [Candidatus Gottesmanbacteria bacterium]
MRILFATYEVAPYFQTGGLGEVARDLPNALGKFGVKTTIVLPKYKLLKLPNKTEFIKNLDIHFAGKTEKVGVYKMNINREKNLYLISHPFLLDPRNSKEPVLMFVLFSKTISQLILNQGKIFGNFDIIHLNDLHPAMVAYFLKHSDIINTPATILTIHNLLYQGPVERIKLSQFLDINFGSEGWTSLLEQGIINADYITTVSPTYAKEIIKTRKGANLRKILQQKQNRVFGILNGIDYRLWNPQTDKLITKNFNINNIFEVKQENKLALKKRLKIHSDSSLPLVSFIGRLEPNQKGIDITYEMFKTILSESICQVVLLGTGNEIWAKKMGYLIKKYPKRFSFINKFDEVLSHQIYAASDIILIPSKYEPCGLVQMIAMRYGTLPLVRKTGGLADTVKDGINGFVFERYSSTELTRTLRLVLKLFKENPEKIAKMRENAMKEDFSWDKSAKEYKKLYQKLIKENK